MTTIIIITYKSGTTEARFSTDQELLDLIVDNFDYIDDIQQVEFTGKLPIPPAPPQLTDERAMRNIIRNIGRTATKNLMEP